MKKFVLCFVFFLSTNMFAQIPQLLKDIEPGPDGSLGQDGLFYPYKNKLLFGAYGSAAGIYVTDGTPAGTLFLAHGSAGSMRHIGDKMYFLGSDSIHGQEPWISDGTPAGTYMLKDFSPGTQSSELFDTCNIFLLNNEVHFVISIKDPSLNLNGQYLCKTNGTPTGTVRVDDFCITPSCSGSKPLVKLLKVIWQKNGYFFFIGNDTSTAQSQNREIWMSNGTSVPSQILKEINAGIRSAEPKDFYEFNNELYFFADDFTHGDELWKTNGTTAGTQMIKDLWPGNSGGFVNDGCSECNAFHEINGNLIFIARTLDQENNEIWKTDGTANGTVVLKEIGPGLKGLDYNNHATKFFYRFNNKILFFADDSVHGSELWRTDGTTNGTALVMDINPGVASSNAYDLFTFKNMLYFSANDGVHGTELWRSDATLSTTALFKDIWPGSNRGYGQYYDQTNKYIFFSGATSLSNSEVWKSDGTSTGTSLVKDINSASGGCCWGGLAAGNMFFFSGSDVAYQNQELWQTDGRTAGTKKVYEINPSTVLGEMGADIFKIYRAGSHLVFKARASVSDREPWSYSPPTLPRVRIGNADETNVNTYPNPSTGIFNIEFADVTEGNYSLTVFDIFGKEILSKEINLNADENLSELDISKYSDGTYIVNLINDTTKETLKLVKISE